MKILQLIHSNQNRGAETFASQLSNHLQEKGHQVKMVSVYLGEADLPFQAGIESLDGNFKNRLLDIKAWKRLSQIIKSYRPDLIQANSGDTLKYAVFSKLIFGWKVPIVMRNASEIGRYLHSTPQKIFNGLLFRNVDLVVSVSKASKKDIINIFPFLKEKTHVITVGLESAEVDEDTLLEPWGMSHILHVGGFSFEKNHQGILKIFKKVLQKQKKVHLHLIGDGILRKEIEKKAKELDIKQYISFYGYVNSPLAYIKAADVLILPSKIEGLPGVILEAMYCRTPVVAYDVGGVSEIVTSETGTLIPFNDESRFATAVLQILEEKPLERIKNAQNMVLRNFMNSLITEQFLKVYDELLEN